MRHMTLPPEALLLRRMEGLLFQIASTVRAEDDWGALLQELIEGEEPVSELGVAHAEWLAARSMTPGALAAQPPPSPCQCPRAAAAPACAVASAARAFAAAARL